MPIEALHLRFDAATHPSADDRVAAFRDAMSVSTDVLFQPEEIEPFRASIDLYSFGKVVVGEVVATRHTMWRRASSPSRSSFNNVIFDVFPDGALTLQAGDAPFAVAPGDCVMVDLAGTFHVQPKAGLRFLAVVVPRKLFDERTGRVIAVHGRHFKSDSPAARLLTPLIEGLLEQAARLSESFATSAGLSLVSMIGACAAAEDVALRQGRPGPVASVASVRRYVDRHAADPAFDADRLCAHFGLSRTALYRLLKPIGGVAEAIRQRRAALAMKALRKNGKGTPTLAEIASASGFSSSRALRRALLELYGASPTAIRRTAPDKSAHDPQHGAAIGALFDGA